MKRLVVAFDDDRQNRVTLPVERLGGRTADEAMGDIALTGRLGSRVVHFAYVIDQDTMHGSDVSAVYPTANGQLPSDVSGWLRADTVRHPFVRQP